MKLISFLGCIFVAAFAGQSNAIDGTTDRYPIFPAGVPTPPPMYDGPPTVPPRYTGPPTQIVYTGPPTKTTHRPTPPMPPTPAPTPPSWTYTKTTYKSTTPTTTTAAATTESAPHKKPCGSNSLGDYRGGCDESVPVIVMPKGRPIMERVLDWFKCGTKACLPEKSEMPTMDTESTGSI